MNTTIPYVGDLTVAQKDALRQQLARGERDRPLVFKGRRNIIEQVESQLEKLQTSSETVHSSTQVIQGAPGSGKTSLLNQLEERFSQESIVIKLYGGDLTDNDRFLSRVLRSAKSGIDMLSVERGRNHTAEVNLGVGKGSRTSARTQASPLATKDVRTVWELIEKSLGRSRRKVVLLCVDEAQSIQSGDMSNKPTNLILLDLHTSQTDNLRILPIFAGLNDTETILGNEGLSRLDHNFVFHLSSLSLQEAKAVVKGVLEHKSLGLTNLFTQESAEFIATALATASQWPRHLHYYIQGVLQELQYDQECESTQHSIDLNKALEYGHQSSVRYYDSRARLVGTEFVESTSNLLLDPEKRLTKANVHTNARKLFDMSNEQFDRLYQKAIHDGLIEETGSGGRSEFRIPIPSLETFLRCECDLEKTKEILRNDHAHALQAALTTG